MLRSFRNKALRLYWTKGDVSGIRPDWRKKTRLILARMEVAQTPDEMDLPGLGFHRLSGDQVGRYSVWISRNWRITFAWAGEDACDIDMEDYHGD